MAIREIEYTVGESNISPATLQPGGIQGEHNATLLSFNIDEALWTKLSAEKELEEDAVLIYRIDGSDGLGNVHPSDVTVLDEPTVKYLLPKCVTVYGGKVKVTLIITLYSSDKTIQELHSCSAQIQIKASNTHCVEHDEDQTISALAYGAKMSVVHAEAAAERAEYAQAQTEDAAVVFEEGSEVVFLGGDAENGSEVLFKVDGAVIKSSPNAVSGKAVYEALESAKDLIEQNNDILKTYADNAAGAVDEKFSAFSEGVATSFSEFGVSEIKNDDGETLYTWYYLKLSCGFAICWGIFDFSITESIQYGSSGNLYYSEQKALQIPFDFENAFFSGSATNSYYVGNSSTSGNTLKFRFSRAYKTEGEAANTKLFLIGKLKEETADE